MFNKKKHTQCNSAIEHECSGKCKSQKHQDKMEDQNIEGLQTNENKETSEESQADQEQETSKEITAPEDQENLEDQFNYDSDDINELRDIIEAQTKKLKEEQVNALRSYAEFDTYRRRMQQEKQRTTAEVTEKILFNLLPILDDFKRSFQNFDNENTTKKTIIEGIKLLRDKFSKTLEKEGLQKIHVDQYDVFNTDFHEAIVKQPIQDKSKKGLIIDVIEEGYQLKDKVIRFAKVIIGV